MSIISWIFLRYLNSDVNHFRTCYVCFNCKNFEHSQAKECAEGEDFCLVSFCCKYFLSIYGKIYLNIWKGGWAACLSVYEYFQYFICEYLKYFVCEYFKYFVCMQVFCKYFLTLTKNFRAAEGAQRGGNCGQGLCHLGNLQHGWTRWEQTNCYKKQISIILIEQTNKQKMCHLGNLQHGWTRWETKNSKMQIN